MNKNDVIRIFYLQDEDDAIRGNGITTIDNFLNIAGFKDCNPTKIDMLAFDNGAKGYIDLINQGNFA